MRNPGQSDIAAQTLKARVVQHQGRRFSLRLEAIYWHRLEQLARRGNLRLGQLIARLADGCRSGNLSSHLRVVSMLEAERALADRVLGAHDGGLLALVRACPCPGLVLSEARVIVACNDAFSAWLGPGHPALGGREVTSLLQLRARGSFGALWADLTEGRLDAAEADVRHVSPGRTNAAQARLVPLRCGDRAYVVMWLTAKP